MEEKETNEPEQQKRKRKEEEAETLRKEQEKLTEKQKMISSIERDLAEKEQTAKAGIDAANELIKHGKERLDNVFKHKNIDRQALPVAQMMIETASQPCDYMYVYINCIINPGKGLYCLL